MAETYPLAALRGIRACAGSPHRHSLPVSELQILHNSRIPGGCTGANVTSLPDLVSAAASPILIRHHSKYLIESGAERFFLRRQYGRLIDNQEVGP